MIGKIIIDAQCTVDEFALYEKYAGVDKYPNVIIEYSDKVTKLEPKAVEIKFMGSEDANAATFYRVLGRSGQSNIGHLISAEGPTGVAIANPSKSDTSEFTYTFTGYWKDSLDENANKYYVDGLENPVGATNFNTVIPTSNMVFYPIFQEEKKKHAIKFFDYDGNVILQNGEETFGVPYGEKYRAAGGPMTNFYYKDSGDLPANKRYSFKGWSTSRFEVDKGKNMEYFNLEEDIVTKAMNLYPYYETEDVYSVATSEEYFTITSTGVISVRGEYKSTLAGKITIPTKLKNDAGNMIEVTAIGSMGENKYETNSEITHVYFLSDSKVSAVNANAFAYCNHLQVVDLPKTVRTIGSSSFVTCEALTTVTLNDNITAISDDAFSGCKKLEINSLPSQLTTLGSSAFQSCGEGIKLTSLPSGVTTLGNFTFTPCSNVKLIDLSGVKKIGAGCFDGAGNGITSLVIGE